MRRILAAQIAEATRRMCIDASRNLPADVRRSVAASLDRESYAPARETLGRIIENCEIALSDGAPICQDTGVACVFVEIGQDVRVEGDLAAAINEGVRRGYEDGLLRKSLVVDPIRRENTGDNTPAMIHYDVVPGDGFRITIAPKGFGSENMSRLKMLSPSDGLEGVKAFVLETVELAGANPCPPVVVGVGLGGTFDKVALLAKKSLLRDADDAHPDPFYARLERELLEEINALGIGPMGLGGRTTALAVKIGAMATHIAGLPVAVNLNCHVARRAREEL